MIGLLLLGAILATGMWLAAAHFDEINSDPDPRQRYIRRRMFIWGLTNLNPPPWAPEEIYAAAHRQRQQHYANQYDRHHA